MLGNQLIIDSSMDIKEEHTLKVIDSSMERETEHPLKKVKVEIKFNDYLANDFEVIKVLKDVILKEGKHLFVAPTGTGKTNVISKVFKKLSKEHTDKIFIIACPNRVQNLQNETSYNLKAIVGGKQIPSGLTTASMVYDKAKSIFEYAVKENKKVCLVVDEAHQLIDSSFRVQALKALKELSNKAISTVHLTATPRKLQELYEYDNIYIAKNTNINNNIKKHILMIIEKNADSKIIDICKAYIDKKKRPFIFINNKNSIKALEKILTQKGYKVGIFNSEEKDNEIFESVSNTELLPSGYDIFLSTSVCECGLNIKNTDIVLINCIIEYKYLDMDSVTQRMARFRNKIDEAITIITKMEKEKVVCKDAIFNEFDFKINRAKLNAKQFTELNKEHLKSIGVSFDDFANSYLNLVDAENNKIGLGCLYAENGEIKIDKEKAVKKKFSLLDRQYYHNYEEFNEILKEHIKADNFIISNYKARISHGTLKGMKGAKQEIKKAKEEREAEAREVLKSITEEKELLYLYEYLFSKEDVFEYFPKSAREKIKVLQDQEKLLKNMESMCKVGIEIKDAVNLILTMQNKGEITDYIRGFKFLQYNKGILICDNIVDEYNLCRRVFDEVMQKQGRITKGKLLELYESLIQYEHLRPSKLDKEKELSKVTTKKLLKTLSLIYSLSKDTIGIRLSSLKK